MFAKSFVLLGCYCLLNWYCNQPAETYADLDSNAYYADYLAIYNNFERIPLTKTKVELQKYVKQFPQEHRGWLFLGKVNYELNLLDQADSAYRKALEIEKSADAFSGLGTIARDYGYNEAARNHYQNALSTNENYPLALHGLAVIDLFENKLPEAKKHLEMALEQDSNNLRVKKTSFIVSYYFQKIDSIQLVAEIAKLDTSAVNKTNQLIQKKIDLASYFKSY